ncbi:MAG: hypothetical protein WA894_08420 [Candidatus Acidiferrum sp.]|jgi:hypothetical protein
MAMTTRTALVILSILLSTALSEAAEPRQDIADVVVHFVGSNLEISLRNKTPADYIRD